MSLANAATYYKRTTLGGIYIHLRQILSKMLHKGLAIGLRWQTIAEAKLEFDCISHIAKPQRVAFRISPIDDGWKLFMRLVEKLRYLPPRQLSPPSTLGNDLYIGGIRSKSVRTGMVDALKCIALVDGQSTIRARFKKIGAEFEIGHV